MNTLPILHIARVCLETRTGLSIASGLSEGGYDVLLVRDANGLPALPGSSLAGVLRHIFQDLHGDSETRGLFGAIDKDAESASRLHISWGAVHDQHDRPVEGLLLGDELKRLETDPVLRFLAQPQPVLRDHVSLNHRGAAADKTKFDRGLLPPGCRFSLELSLNSEDPGDPRWQRVLDLLHHPRFRLGGATRRGLGAFDVPRLHARSLDLRDPGDFATLARLPAGLGEVTGLEPVPPPEPRTDDRCLTAHVTLVPEDFFRFGQGDEPLSESKGTPLRQLPLRQPRITWSHGRGGISEQSDLLVPASAIKGALRHRFVFHLLRHGGAFVEEMADADTFDFHSLPEVQALFGFAKEDDDSVGRAGRLLMDDLTLPVAEVQPGRMMHNSQDRFTGGVRAGVLFGEELVWRRPLTLTLTVLDPREMASPPLRRALRETLADLIQGRLALGAGGSKGHGYGTGVVSWSDDGQWIAETTP